MCDSKVSFVRLWLRIEPLLEFSVHTFEHLIVLPARISETSPIGDIVILSRPLNLHDELVHQPQVVRVFLAEV